jgi:hypothetical protein
MSIEKNEDAVPVNNVGGGNIAGAGVGPNGEPGVKKKKKLRSIISRIGHGRVKFK